MTTTLCRSPTSVLQASLVCGIIALCLASVVHADCLAQSMPGFTPADFVSSPTPMEEANACQQYTLESCCSSDFTFKVMTQADPLSQLIYQVIDRNSYIPDDCQAAIDSLICIMCNPDQSDYINVHRSFSTFEVCLGFCNNLFNACKNVLVKTDAGFSSIVDTYPDGDSLCYDILGNNEGILRLDVESDSTCWSNIPPCTEDDYYPEYTECYAGHRSLAYLLKPASECQGGYQPPPIQNGLDCSIDCNAGYFLDSATQLCKQCPPGEFSLGGGVRLSPGDWTAFDDMSLDMETYCYSLEWDGTQIPLDNCGWKLQGDFAVSGNHDDSVDSVLAVHVNMVRNGTLAVSYQVVAEYKYDGFYIKVDHVIVFPMVSVQTTFKIITIPLTKGFHTVEFIYHKDISMAMGSDEASISILEITGTAHADTSCTLCPLGTFSPNRGSYYCQPCTVNTFASKLGSKSCEACSEDSFSLSGADSCEDSLPCTHADMGIRYGPCSESGYRQRYFYWLQPQICNPVTGVALNASDSVACPPCDAGTYRDHTTHQCEYCPLGTARSSDEPECHTCIPGNEGVTTVEFDDFYEFSNGLNTSCVGSCASSGWLLREDHVESGYDKGVLQLKQTLTRTGTLTFVFSLYCSDNCALFFNDNNGTSLAFFGGPGAWYQPEDDRISVSINAGPQTLEWNFANIGDSTSNKAVISFISLTRVSVGGATSCTPCEAGTYSPDGSPCKLVPAGFYSKVGATQPLACSDTSFTDEVGQSECTECGPGTFSNEDHTACLETCSFQPDPVNYPYLAFDLSALKKDDMIGPIYDYAHEDEQIYYVNMCSKQHRNHSCLDGDGAPIPSYSCQITNHGYGVNLGDLIGFIPDDEDIRSGLTVQFSHGDMCDADISSGHYSPFPRTTTIEMICDPSAGTGSPVAPVTGVEYERCAYNFEWRSLYACPVCSPDDFSFLISDCGDDNTRTKVFFWKDNPKRCHDGSALPAPIKVPCLEISTYCPPGTWLNTNLDTCIDAEPGYYSIGGGIVYDDWTSVPNVFSAQGWAGYEEFITTDNSAKHNLLLSASYVVSGTVDFEYKVYALDDATASLDLYIDDIKVVSLGSTGFEYKTVSVNVADQGQHFFKWIYGTSTDLSKNPGTSYANIRSIKLVGTQLAALFQTICPAGTYSDTPASTGCTPCTTNTFSNAGYTECKPCDVSQYSFNKAGECTDRIECTVDDFEPIYTDCFGGVIFSQVEPIDPQICFGEYPGYYDYDSAPCFDCSPGQYRSGDDCLTCEIGSYYNTDSQTCVQASKGFAAVPVLAFFTHPETELPANFSVGCYGDCHSEGWRFRGENIDSGSHGIGEVDSFITLTTNFLGEGELSFLYYVDGDGMSGLQLYRDGQPIDIEYHPDPLKRGSDGVFTYVSVPMETGDADITWNFHKEPEAEGYAIIKSIILSGVDNGGATEQVSCSPGYFSNSKGASRCTVCPAGTYTSTTGSSSCIACADGYFSENVGSAQCTACGDFTTSNKDHTDCLTSCTYTNDNRVYDLNPLSSSTGPFALANGALIVDICEKQSSPGICLDRTTGEPIDTYACQVFSRGVGVDSGRVLDVEFVPIEDKTPNIVLSFTGGESDEDCDEHTTEITLICDPNVAATSIPTEGATDDCTIRMNWYTPYACPLCQDSDYANRTSECTNNKQTIALAKLATSACYGPTIKKTYTVDCTNGFKLPLIVFLFIAIAFVILFIVIVVIILRNRTLEQKYSILVAESSRNIEMDVSAQQI